MQRLASCENSHSSIIAYCIRDLIVGRFTLNATWTADRFGRRWLFIIGGIGMGICMRESFVQVVVIGTIILTANSVGSCNWSNNSRH